MEVDMVDFLAVAVVDYQPEMPGDPQFLSDLFGCVRQELNNLVRRFIEVAILLARQDQQMHLCLWTMIGDDKYKIVFVEYLAWQFPVDYAREYRWHGGKVRSEPIPCKLPISKQPIAQSDCILYKQLVRSVGPEQDLSC